MGIDDYLNHALFCISRHDFESAFQLYQHAENVCRNIQFTLKQQREAILDRKSDEALLLDCKQEIYVKKMNEIIMAHYEAQERYQWHSESKNGSHHDGLSLKRPELTLMTMDPLTQQVQTRTTLFVPTVRKMAGTPVKKTDHSFEMLPSKLDSNCRLSPSTFIFFPSPRTIAGTPPSGLSASSSAQGFTSAN